SDQLFTKTDPRARTTPSSVATPPVRTHASQTPSPAPSAESHEILRAAAVEPLQGCPTLPVVQPLGVRHGPPSGIPSGVGGDVLCIFTFVGSLKPLSYKAQ